MADSLKFPIDLERIHKSFFKAGRRSFVVSLDLKILAENDFFYRPGTDVLGQSNAWTGNLRVRFLCIRSV